MKMNLYLVNMNMNFKTAASASYSVISLDFSILSNLKLSAYLTQDNMFLYKIYAIKMFY